MKQKLIALGVAAALALAACGGDGDGDTAGTTTTVVEPVETTTPTTGAPETTAVTTGTTAATDPVVEPVETTPTTAGDADGVLNVPDEFATIQEAVDAAEPGQLVLIAPGTYHEAVDVLTDGIVIRGLDRDGVVLDGEFTLDNAIRVLGANDVAVENLTTMNYTNNGVYWVASTGYRASYITTYRTGDYGVYAFDSTNGLIENSHTVGSRDAGVYIGQCYPCDAVIRNVISSNNGLGYSGTNSGGNLLIVESVFHNNRAGIVPNSGSYELCYPERDTTVVGNLVYDNNQPDTPAIDVALLAQGNGILIAGGVRNVVERNRVDNHNRTGIGMVPFLEEFPNDVVPPADQWDMPCSEQKDLPVEVPDGAILWDSMENRVIGNIVSDSREADIAIASADPLTSAFGSCVLDNEAATYAPAALAELAPCDGEPTSTDWTTGDLGVVRWLGEQAGLPPEVDWREAPLPDLGAHENMPDAATAAPEPATNMPPPIDLDAITVPDLP
ncbi:MAG TPA: right-handed parallel beta-helix repeat-containing protein [Ilumatobacter sp.]|nr:right-handed parallel beta-helix repeat-containing protein [Ilumatobacter sp.]